MSRKKDNKFTIAYIRRYSESDDNQSNFIFDDSELYKQIESWLKDNIKFKKLCDNQTLYEIANVMQTFSFDGSQYLEFILFLKDDDLNLFRLTFGHLIKISIKEV